MKKFFFLALSLLITATTFSQTTVMHTQITNDARTSELMVTLSIDSADFKFSEDCGYEFFWSTGDRTSEITFAYPKETTEYTVVIYHDGVFVEELTISSDCFLNLATMPNEVCVGQIVTFMVTTPEGIPLPPGNGYLFYWSDQGNQPGPPTRQIVATTPGVLAPTVYVSHSSGCATSMTGHATVSQGSFIAWSAVPSEICIGQSVTFRLIDQFGNPLPNGQGWTYEWPAPFQNSNTSSVTLTPTSDIVGWTVTVTDPGGCTQVMDSHNVKVWPVPNVNIKKYFLVSGGALLDAGFSPNTSYEWSNGEVGQTAEVHTPGTYYVTATNEHGCTKVASCQIAEFEDCDPEVIYVEVPVYIEVPVYVDTCIGGPEPCNVTAVIHSTDNKTSICENDQLDLTVNVTGAQGQTLYNWNNGKVTKSITITGGGDYSVTVTDQNGCTAVATFWVDEKSAPNAWVGPNGATHKWATLCIEPGDNEVNALSVLFVSVENLNLVEEIDWYPSGGQTTNNQQAYSYYLPAGVHEFQATVRGKNGCSTNVFFHITVEHCGCCGIVGTEDTTGVMEEEKKIEFFNTLGQKVEGELYPFTPYIEVIRSKQNPDLIYGVRKFAILEK